MTEKESNVNELNISRETFVGMPTKAKLDVLYDLVTQYGQNICKLDKKVDRGRKVDITVAAVMGFFGGLAGHIGQWLISGGSKPPTGV